MADHKVLLLDDDPVSLGELRGMLPGGNFSLIEVMDGKAALTVIKDEVKNLRLMVLKFNLPQVSGWKILSKAQEHPKLREIPMVLVAEAHDPVSKVLPEPRYFAIIHKPFNRKQFQNAIKQAVHRAALPRDGAPAAAKTAPPKTKVAAPPPPPKAPPKAAQVPAPPPPSQRAKVAAPPPPPKAQVAT
ncbi:response regulator, partial [Spirulina sp. CCNP1310]|uniref:response regulator n=1 Tax=Spirulina sp. CCNP1310 TaxID=3110249 RepID=UPI002B21DCEF